MHCLPARTRPIDFFSVPTPVSNLETNFGEFRKGAEAICAAQFGGARVRDVEKNLNGHYIRSSVAGSNPAIPTRPQPWPSISHNYMKLLANLGTPRVHKGVHKRVVRMVTLRQDSRGNYIAHRRLPNDVRDEYGHRHGPHVEAKFFALAGTGLQAAKQLFREWETEVEGRIGAIRAERNGEGIALTPRQARASGRENCAVSPTSDLAAALRLLMRREQGDYSADKYPDRFPKADQSSDALLLLT